MLDALREEGPRIHFPDLLRRLVHEYLNVFLNTFCTQAGRSRARELSEADQTEKADFGGGDSTGVQDLN